MLDVFILAGLTEPPEYRAIDLKKDASSADLATAGFPVLLEAAAQRIIYDAHLIGLNIISASILPRGADKNWKPPMEGEWTLFDPLDDCSDQK